MHNRILLNLTLKSWQDFSIQHNAEKGLRVSQLTEDSRFGLKLTSLAIAAIFIFTTAVSVGWMLADQARASSRLTMVEEKVDNVDSRIRDDVLKIKEDVAEIKGMLKERR